MALPAPPSRSTRPRHESLQAWQAAKELVLLTYRVTGTWPPDERFGLVSQARRAAISVAANIAEGAAKRGPREFRRFLDMALGSLAELHVYLVLTKELGILAPGPWGELEALRDHTGRLVWGLCRAVDGPTPAKPGATSRRAR